MSTAFDFALESLRILSWSVDRGHRQGRTRVGVCVYWCSVRTASRTQALFSHLFVYFSLFIFFCFLPRIHVLVFQCSCLFFRSVSLFVFYFLDNFWTSFSSSSGDFVCKFQHLACLSLRAPSSWSEWSHFIASCSCFRNVASS